MKAMRLLALLMAAALAVPVLSGCSNGTTTDGGDESTDNGDIALNEVGTVYTRTRTMAFSWKSRRRGIPLP